MQTNFNFTGQVIEALAIVNLMHDMSLSHAVYTAVQVNGVAQHMTQQILVVAYEALFDPGMSQVQVQQEVVAITIEHAGAEGQGISIPSIAADQVAIQLIGLGGVHVQ